MDSEYNQFPEIVSSLILGISFVMILVMVFILPWRVRKEQREFDRARQEAAEKAKAGENEDSSAVTGNADSDKQGTDNS